MAEGQTALVVLVPEAETAIGAIRAAHDPSAARGVPAHVTVLLPFVPAGEWSSEVDLRVAAVFRQHEPFDARFRRSARFGTNTLYLVPEPSEPFVALTNAVVAEFPAYPPYRGAHAEVIPHLTLADDSADAVDAAALAHAATAPFTTRVSGVTLLVQRDGRWHFEKDWRLGTDEGVDGAVP